MFSLSVSEKKVNASDVRLLSSTKQRYLFQFRLFCIERSSYRQKPKATLLNTTTKKIKATRKARTDSKNWSNCDWADFRGLYYKFFTDFRNKLECLSLSGARQSRVGPWPYTQTRLGWKGLPGTNTSLLRKSVNYGRKSFIVQAQNDRTKTMAKVVFNSRSGCCVYAMHLPCSVAKQPNLRVANLTQILVTSL